MPCNNPLCMFMPCNNPLQYSFTEIDKEHAVPGTMVWISPFSFEHPSQFGTIVETDIPEGYGIFRLLVLVAGEMVWFLSTHIRRVVKSED